MVETDGFEPLHKSAYGFMCDASHYIFLRKKVGIAFAMPTFLVETDGFEPSTPCMSSKYSNQLSYASVPGLLYYKRNKNAIDFLKFF